jgi:hypothetical protein
MYKTQRKTSNMNNSLIIKIFIVRNTSIIIKKVCLVVKDIIQPHLLFLWQQHTEILLKDKPFQIDRGKFVLQYMPAPYHEVQK